VLSDIQIAQQAKLRRVDALAAERLGITKAVVSQQVARLERAFETTLLVRTTRSVRMTPAGEFLFHCNTCDTDWTPSGEEVAKLRKEFGKKSE
jgi:hypothetical protein